MFFIVSSTARMCLAAIGAHVPFSTSATLRPCMPLSLSEDRNASIAGAYALSYVVAHSAIRSYLNAAETA